MDLPLRTDLPLPRLPPRHKEKKKNDLGRAFNVDNVFAILATHSLFGILTIIYHYYLSLLFVSIIYNCENWAKSWKQKRYISVIKKEDRLDI